MHLVQTSESPALRGFVAERGPVRGTSLYLVLLSNGQIRGETLRNGAWPGGEHPSPMARFPTVGAGFTGPFHTSPTNAATFVSRGCGGYTRHPSPEPRTQRLTGRNTGPSLSRPQRGFVLSAKLPPKEQPEKVDARLMACVRFLRRRGPAGLRSSSVHLQNRQDPLQSLLYYGTISLPVNG